MTLKESITRDAEQARYDGKAKMVSRAIWPGSARTASRWPNAYEEGRHDDDRADRENSQEAGAAAPLLDGELRD